MVRTLAQHWWVLLLRGLLAILFGVLTFARPGITIVVLVLFWGAYALVDGIFEVVAGVRAKWGSLILLGILGIVAGVVTFAWPGITAIVLLYIIAFWAIVAGVMQIVAAIRLRREIEGEWLWILSGLCTVILGAWLIARPGAGAVSLVWLIASFAIAWGILLVILSFRLKGHHGRLMARPA
ncbi:MAG: HdeD family acid-resistance protein [Syntrophomonadaceae bacterium]